METWVVPLSDVDVSEELAEAVRETVKSGWWSMGPRVAELEREFASLCGTAHALAVANGTVALHAALVACGCGPGDEVVLPSLNFVAAANVVVHTGAMPVFCDIVGEEDLNLDPRDLEAALSPSTKAVIALHYGGHPCAMDEVLALAAGRAFSVVEDAAHAPGATLDGRRVRLDRRRSAASASSRTRTFRSAREGCWSRTTTGFPSASGCSGRTA